MRKKRRGLVKDVRANQKFHYGVVELMCADFIIQQ